MFYKKVRLNNSTIHGIGLFAAENISRGESIYKINEKIDLFLSKKEFSKLSENEKQTIRHYGYFDKIKNKWHLSFDDIRFCNHGVIGNISLQADKLVAIKNIKKGEELIQNYQEFENLRSKLK